MSQQYRVPPRLWSAIWSEVLSGTPIKEVFDTLDGMKGREHEFINMSTDQIYAQLKREKENIFDRGFLHAMGISNEGEN